MDEAILRWVNSHNAPWLDDVMLTLSNRWFGVGIVVVLGLALTLRALRGRQWPYTLPPVFVLGAIGLTLGLSDSGGARVLKPLFDRERPCFALTGVRTLYEQSHSPSLPSLHSANTAALAVVLALFARGRERWLAAMVAVGAVLVGYSRVYLGVHWPTDVLAGYLWGALVAGVVWLAVRRLG